MANYEGQNAFTANFAADVDLTAVQYKLVIPASTSGNVASANSGCSVMPLGILTNDPSAGQPAAVTMLGFAKGTGRATSCYLAHGTLLVGASDAILEPALSTTLVPVIARWFGPRVTTADASVLGNVLLLGLGGASGMLSVQAGAG